GSFLVSNFSLDWVTHSPKIYCNCLELTPGRQLLSSVQPRANGKCLRGVTLLFPSWLGKHPAFQPFPASPQTPLPSSGWAGDTSGQASTLPESCAGRAPPPCEPWLAGRWPSTPRR